MGRLVPEDFDVAGMDNEAERRVVQACVHGLSDGWLVLPNVAVKAGTRDHELDVVLVHESFGVVDLEVKGHQPELRQGVWFAHGARMEPQPPSQAHDNAYALRSRVRSGIDCLRTLKVPYAVVLPNASGLEGRLGVDLKPEQVITAPMLDDMADAVERVATMWATTVQLDADDVAGIVDMLRPDAEFGWEPEARASFARRRLDELCDAQVKALETLDANRRVVVLGAAGTGKTRLAEGWARRALLEDRTVLFTCYNDPLAQAVARRLPAFDGLTVGPFLRVALGLGGMAPLPVPADAGHAWWTEVVPAHLAEHWGEVTARFDTIVVDEAQDLSPRWLGWLEELLSDDGRLLVVADPAQELYVRGFEVPSADDGWTRCELVINCRNAQQIAHVLRRRLSGATAPAVAPEALGQRFSPVVDGDADAVVAAVREELAWVLDDEGRDPERIAVLTCSSALRDRLRSELRLSSWEAVSADPEGAHGRILCENVHRTKGMEFDTVLLVADGEVSDDLLYVGVSRAVSELAVIAPAGVGQRLGLA